MNSFATPYVIYVKQPLIRLFCEKEKKEGKPPLRQKTRQEKVHAAPQPNVFHNNKEGNVQNDTFPFFNASYWFISLYNLVRNKLNGPKLYRARKKRKEREWVQDEEGMRQTIRTRPSDAVRWFIIKTNRITWSGIRILQQKGGVANNGWEIL